MNPKRRIFLILFLFVTGVFTTYCSSSLNENLEGKIYLVDISMHAKDMQGDKIEPIYIQPFAFTYDFSKQKGNISFRVKENLTFEHISIHFPALVKDETFRVLYLRGDEKIPINKGKLDQNHGFYQEENHSYISFSDHDNLFLEEGEGLLIEFESEINPKARFNFIIGNGLVLYRNPDEETGNINLILGEKYQCITPCLYGLNNIEETYNSFEGNLKLEWQAIAGNSNHVFYINTFSTWTLFLKNLFSSLGTGLIVSLIIELIGGWEEIKEIGKKTVDKIRKEI